MKATSMPDETGQLVLTLRVAGQLCGVPVLSVRDVLALPAITRVPLAPPEVAGSLNLRGRIVTALDLRRRLGLAPRTAGQATMSVVVEQGGELYSLLADEVGEVLRLHESDRAPNPPALERDWGSVSTGVHRQGEELLVMLEVEGLLAIPA